MEYGEGTDAPFHKVWHHDNYVHETTDRFISQTNGMDAIQTFNVSHRFCITK